MIDKNQNAKCTARHMNALGQYVPVKEYTKKAASGRVSTVYFTAGAEHNTRAAAVQAQLDTFNTLVYGGVYSDKDVSELLSWKASDNVRPLFEIK